MQAGRILFQQPTYLPILGPLLGVGGGCELWPFTPFICIFEFEFELLELN